MKTLAIIVNYHSALLTLSAVQSVLESRSCGRVQVVVVDNSENDAELEILRCQLPKRAHLVVNPRNVGFGRACNQVLEQFSAEALLLLNPDARLLPEALLTMQKVLFKGERAGAVSPRIFWDNGFRFQLPPAMFPFMFEFPVVFSGAGMLSRFSGHGWRWYCVRLWKARSPVFVGNMSGGAALIRTAAVKRAGGLFDPRFFLYFEDTDLFLRLRRAGYRLLVEPRAVAVHHYDQCGKHEIAQKRHRMAESRALFLEKYHRPWKSWIKRVIKPFNGTAGLYPEARTSGPMSIRVPVGARGNWLFELSPSPNLIPAAGYMGSGPEAGISPECWHLMAPGCYFWRLGKVGGVYRPSSLSGCFEKR